MTNLLLAYNLIPFQAKDITPSYTSNSLYPEWNLLTNKVSDWTVVDAGGSWNIVFDLGLDSTGADIEKVAEYIILTNLNAAIPSGLITFFLDYSDDGSSWSTATSFTNAVTLSGLMQTDYIKTFTATAAHRYWRIRSSGDTEGISKCYFGTFLDLGTDPDKIKDEFERPKYYISDGGYSTYGITKPEQRKYSFEWRGITKAKLAEFETIIRGLPEKPLFFLYLQTVTDILNGENLLAVTLEDYDFEFLSDDYIVLSMDFKDSL